MELVIIGVVIIVWLACAFGCAAIAKSKNKSAFVWFWLGLILGIIGILIIGFMKAEEGDWDEDRYEDEYGDGDSRFPCPSCAEMVLV